MAPTDTPVRQRRPTAGEDRREPEGEGELALAEAPAAENAGDSEESVLERLFADLTWNG